MTLLPQLALTFLVLVFCLGDMAALSFLISWQERAPSPGLRRLRLWRGVLPAALVLLALLLAALTQLIQVWTQA